MVTTPETQTPSQETAKQIADTLGRAREATESMTVSPDFEDGYIQWRQELADQFPGTVEPVTDMSDETSKPEYWEYFAYYANGGVAADGSTEDGAIADGEGSAAGMTEHARSAMRLLAGTPHFLFSQERLERLRKDPTGRPRTRRNLSADEKREYDAAREAVSGFNALIRSFAEAYPKAQVSDVQLTLLETAHELITDGAMPADAERYIGDAVRGAQHEVALGAALKSLNMPYRSAGLNEDLDGADWIVEVDGREFRIDAKASDRKIKAQYGYRTLGDRISYRFSGPDTIMACLGWGDAEFNGKFFPTERATGLVCRALGYMIDEAATGASR